MQFSSILLLVVVFNIANYYVVHCRNTESSTWDALEILVQLEFEVDDQFWNPSAEFVPDNLDEVEVDKEIEEKESLEDWELSLEDRIPFEKLYPTLARDYKYPPVPYKQLRRTIQSALKETKGPKIERLQSQKTDVFIHVENHQFMLGENPFYFVGFNSYYALQHAVKKEDRKRVDHLLETARDQNLNVMRVFAFCDGPGLEPTGTWSGFYVPCKYTFQESPGVLNKEVFDGLDYLIYKAGQNDIRLILTLSNYASIFGGVEMYARWAYGTNNLENVTVLDFYTNKDINTMYKAYVAQILTRVNSFNDIPYSEDATIMAWDLMNDARCPDCPGDSFNAVLDEWMNDMGKFVKTLAPKQLVTAGVIGHFGESSPDEIVHNPAPWVVCLGVDFKQLFQSKYLDFASIALYSFHKQYNYPDFVKCSDSCRREWLQRTLQNHMQVAQNTLKKPLVIKEFGLAGERHERHLIFSNILNASAQSALEGDSLGGALFWSGGTKGDMDWDNKMVYIDGSGYYERRPNVKALEEDREYKQWLDASRYKFFRRDLQSECQAVKEEEYFDTFTYPPTYQNDTIMRIIHNMGDLTCELGSNCDYGKFSDATNIYGVMS